MSQKWKPGVTPSGIPTRLIDASAGDETWILPKGNPGQRLIVRRTDYSPDRSVTLIAPEGWVVNGADSVSLISGALADLEVNYGNSWSGSVSPQSVVSNLNYPDGVTKASVVPRPVRIDVRDHGAVGDGVTDDRAALQAAINAVGAGGGEVCVPAGSYKVTSSLALRSGARIVGSGRGRSRILAAPGISTAVLLGTSGAAVVDVDIVDLCIDGAWGSVTVALAGMQVTNGSRITVERCDLQNLGGPGVLLQGLSGASGTPDSLSLIHI